MAWSSVAALRPPILISMALKDHVADTPSPMLDEVQMLV